MVRREGRSGRRDAGCELLDSPTAYRIPGTASRYRRQTAEKSVSANPAPRSIHCSVMAKPAWRPRSSIWVGSYLYELSVQIRSPRAKENVASAGIDTNRLRGQALEVHLDPLCVAVPDRAMREGVEIERPAELAVDADEQVPVERGGDAERIVVGEHAARASGFTRSAPSSSESPGASAARIRAQELVRGRRVEVADVRAEQQHEHRMRRRRARAAARRSPTS